MPVWAQAGCCGDASLEPVSRKHAASCNTEVGMKVLHGKYGVEEAAWPSLFGLGVCAYA